MTEGTTDTTAAPPLADREALILAVARGFHDFEGGHPDYPNYDEVACGGSLEYHCEAGHEHGSRGVCWACEPPAAHIVDTLLLPLLAAERDHAAPIDERIAPEGTTVTEERAWCDVAGGELTHPVGDCCRRERRTVTPWVPVEEAASDE